MYIYVCERERERVSECTDTVQYLRMCMYMYNMCVSVCRYACVYAYLMSICVYASVCESM